MFLKSKTGEVLHVDAWQEEVNKFWGIFARAETGSNLFRSRTYPKRPVDAWERYVKIMGLEII